MPASTFIDSPIGLVEIAASDVGLTRVAFGVADTRPRMTTPAEAGEPSPAAVAHCIAACEQLEAYFAGTLTAFTVALDLQGSAFQRAVWDRLTRIRFGGTLTYGAIAREVSPDGLAASRAVGLANHDNPIAIIVPCHRVIGADGTLTGYAGGLPAKRWLLDHEAKVAGTTLWTVEARA